jgi:hypothetical protein
MLAKPEFIMGSSIFLPAKKRVKRSAKKEVFRHPTFSLINLGALHQHLNVQNSLAKNARDYTPIQFVNANTIIKKMGINSQAFCL